MSRPSFQFYPADWLADANLKACTFSEKGVWIELLCLLHQAPEYGILRWPLERISAVIRCRKRVVETLVKNGVLLGHDTALGDAFVFRPYHGRTLGDPVTLIPAQQGPIWFSGRMVRDEHKRKTAGQATRFGSPSQRDGESPSRGDGESPSQRQGDGSSSSPSPSPSSSSKDTLLGMDTVSREPELARRVFLEGQNSKPKPPANPNWEVPSLSDPEGLERYARKIGVDPQRFGSYRELQAHLIERVTASNNQKRNVRPSSH
jgi:hypothetical protein